ncbi:MAG: 8-oxo-dGTP diphosphatase [Candidatus Delongbacteria bacterium]|nr:8-oxo-dGTP diphosphatase [Candidatus Delongbacteria bacterium]MBN2834458.1 8-oxo-dGTP diphosphatase [Candidatus Delongbacteria bacterium]
MSKLTLTNMCMIHDLQTDMVVVIDRVKTYKGISFPGGHIKDGEGIVDSVKREIFEETGLTIDLLEPCGVIYWYNEDNGDRYFVFNYRTTSYKGVLKESCEEGRVFWVKKDEMIKLNLSEGITERLPMFFEKKFNEGFSSYNSKQKNPLTFY